MSNRLRMIKCKVDFGNGVFKILRVYCKNFEEARERIYQSFIHRTIYFIEEV